MNCLLKEEEGLTRIKEYGGPEILAVKIIGQASY